MKLLVDVNLSPLWVGWLQEAGFEAVYWSDFGKNSDPDPLIRQFARKHSYVILTLDLDFGIDLADTQQNRPSVVQIRIQFASSKEVRELVIKALHETTPELEQGPPSPSVQIAFASGYSPSADPASNRAA